VLNVSSTFVGGFEIGNNLDRAGHSAQAVLHIAEVQGMAQIWWRFGGGSDRNRALLGNKDNSMHFANRAKPHKHWRLRISLIRRVGT
jgi:hypothetical protein